jgi:hypothetical protein
MFAKSGMVVLGGEPCTRLSRTEMSVVLTHLEITLQRPDCLAGVRGLELRYPGTRYVFEMSMITRAGSAEARQHRLFAFELRRQGHAARPFADHRPKPTRRAVRSG